MSSIGLHADKPDAVRKGSSSPGTMPNIISTASALLMDSIVCIFRRLNNKENIFTPHKKHLYQRLNQNGMSHQKVAAIYAIGTLILIFFSQTNNLVLMSSLVFVLFLFGIYLEKNYAKPFNF